MKAKDMPSVRARRFADQCYRELRRLDGSMNAVLAKDRIISAYMAGYLHGRKQAKNA